MSENETILEQGIASEEMQANDEVLEEVELSFGEQEFLDNETHNNEPQYSIDEPVKSTSTEPIKSTSTEPKDLYGDRQMLQEYDDAFDGEEKLEQKLSSIKSKVTLLRKEIAIEDIVLSDFKKVSRVKTIKGLTDIVGSYGVVNPIHVLKLEDDDSYLLLDGLRRVYAATAIQGGNAKIQAVIWDFEDVDEGKDMALVLSLMINRVEHYSNLEAWNVMSELLRNSVSPGLCEYLLQLEPGDGMKLQDIMTADVPEFGEDKEKFLADEYSIDQAYKKLTKARKAIDKLEKEDKTEIVSDSTGGMTAQETSGEQRELGYDEVLELLDMKDENVDDNSIESLDRTDEVNRPTIPEGGKNEEPLDPAIKQETFRRDQFTCQCCGLSGVDNEANIAVLIYHHVVGRACGGPNTVDNGLTLCQNCHMLLHLYVFGKIHIQWEKMKDNEAETTRYKRICKYGNIQIDAWKKKGVSKKDAFKQDADGRRHLYPGEGLQDLNTAYQQAKANGELDSISSTETTSSSAETTTSNVPESTPVSDNI